MSEMNTPKDKRAELSQTIEGVFKRDPQLLAAIFRELIPELSAHALERCREHLASAQIPPAEAASSSVGGRVNERGQESPVVDAGTVTGERRETGAAPLSRGERGYIQTIISNPNPDARAEAARLLGVAPDPRLGALAELLRDKEMAVVGAAVKALVAIGAPAVPVLCEAAKNKGKPGELRFVAMKALGEIKDPSALPTLIEEALKGEPMAALMILNIGAPEPALRHLRAQLPLAKDDDARSLVTGLIKRLEAW